MAAFISLGLFALLMTAISVYGYGRYAKPGRVYQQLGGPVAIPNPVIDKLDEHDPGLLVTVMEQIGAQIPVAPQDALAARRELIAAGIRSDGAVAVLYGIKVVLCAVLLLLAFTFRAEVTSNPILRIALVVASGMVGYFGPGFHLGRIVVK